MKLCAPAVCNPNDILNLIHTFVAKKFGQFEFWRVQGVWRIQSVQKSLALQARAFPGRALALLGSGVSGFLMAVTKARRRRSRSLSGRTDTDGGACSLKPSSQTQRNLVADAVRSVCVLGITFFHTDTVVRGKPPTPCMRWVYSIIRYGYLCNHAFS